MEGTVWIGAGALRRAWRGLRPSIPNLITFGIPFLAFTLLGLLAMARGEGRLGACLVVLGVLDGWGLVKNLNSDFNSDFNSDPRASGARGPWGWFIRTEFFGWICFTLALNAIFVLAVLFSISDVGLATMMPSPRMGWMTRRNGEKGDLSLRRGGTRPVPGPHTIPTMNGAP